MKNKIEVAVLGATGTVGQKAIALLEDNKEFVITELAASDVKEGAKYSDSCSWREPLSPLSSRIANMKLKNMKDVRAPFVMSCLPADVASEIEPYLANKGCMIFSNASAFRQDKTVPLLVPEINYDHIKLIEKQKTKGKIITNPNCAAVGITMAMAPLMEVAKVKYVSIVTLQSTSGAGYPGVPSLDILGNTIPNISGEATKIVAETKRILGSAEKFAPFDVSAHVNRVPVLFGHSAVMHITFDSPVSIKDASNAYKKWNKKYKDMFLEQPVGYPQPRQLRHDDYAAYLGHFTSEKNVFGVVCLTHNLVRGAAGAVLLNMQAYKKYCGV